jgi:site-specific recombinase XerD
MTAQPLPALTSGDPSAWDQALYAFLIEKGNRSGSRRTVESYSRMLWPFFAERSLTPDRVKPGEVLAWVHGIGRSGRTPSSTTVGARIACLSSFYRFLIRMGLVVSNPCDAVERPRTSGRKLLAEALFERIEVLGARKVRLHPSASAKAQGWDRAWNGARLVVMVGARGVGPTLYE